MGGNPKPTTSLLVLRPPPPASPPPPPLHPLTHTRTNCSKDFIQVFWRFPASNLPFVGGVCNFLSSVSLQQKFETTDESVLQLSFIGKQRKIHPPGVRAGQHKRREEKRGPSPSGLPPFIHLSPPPPTPILPYVNWAIQKGCLFYLRSSLQSLDLPSFYVLRPFPSLSFSHSHFGLRFPILTT